MIDSALGVAVDKIERTTRSTNVATALLQLSATRMKPPYLDGRSAPNEAAEEDAPQNGAAEAGEAGALGEVKCFVVATPEALQPWHSARGGPGVPRVLLVPDAVGWRCPDTRKVTTHTHLLACFLLG